MPDSQCQLLSCSVDWGGIVHSSLNFQYFTKNSSCSQKCRFLQFFYRYFKIQLLYSFPQFSCNWSKDASDYGDNDNIFHAP